MEPKFEIEFIKSTGMYKAFVFNPRLVGRLNKSLKSYSSTVDFEAEGSEGIFKFHPHQYKHVLAILNS